MITRSIINKTKLPDKLTDKEFVYYFEQFKMGDTNSLDKLVMHNLKLVYWYIDENINCETLDYNEVICVGIEALIESFYTYDIDRNVKFSTYATICIRNKLLKYLRNESKHCDKVLSLDEPISDSHNFDTFGDVLMDTNVDLEMDTIESDYDDFLKIEIKKILDNLSDIDRKIIMLYFGFYDGKAYVQKEICSLLGISQSYVSKRLIRSLNSIKLLLKNSFYDEYDKELLIRKVA